MADRPVVSALKHEVARLEDEVARLRRNGRASAMREARILERRAENLRDELDACTRKAYTR